MVDCGDVMETKEVKAQRYVRLGTSGKTAAILLHLQEKGSITSWESYELYRETRLSDTIFRLRQKYDIETIKIPFTDIYGKPSSYGKYIYHGEYGERTKPKENSFFSKIVNGDK